MRGTTAPLSVAQEALWYLSLLVPDLTSYNEAISIRKDGPLDVDALRRAFNKLVGLHTAWRTTFDVDAGEPIQVVHEPEEFELPVIDLSELSFEEAEQHAVRLVFATSKVPYDLRRGPLIRPRLVRFTRDHHRLYLPMHHMAFDAVSIYRIVLPELVALYDAIVAGENPQLDSRASSYVDYARFEQDWMVSPRAIQRLHYWRDHLSNSPRLSLPLDRQRPATRTLQAGAVPLEVPAEVVERLKDAGRTIGATLFQVLATTWAVLLGRYAGQDEVVFSTATDLRQRPEFEAVVGYSVTPIVIRVPVTGAHTFLDLVVRVRNDLLDGLDNLVPFERIVRELGAESEIGANPIYQTMVVFEPPTAARAPTWSVQVEDEISGIVGTSKLDLELDLDERPQGHVTGRLVYDANLFERSSTSRMVEHWQRILSAVAEEPTVDPAALLAITEDEERELARWNATVTIRPPSHVHRMINAHALRAPDAVALDGPDGVLTYGQLVARAGDTASRLRSAGVGEGDVVAFCAEPAAGLVADILGARSVGAAYLLIDPVLPPTLLRTVVEEAGASVVYADPSLGSSLSGASAPIRPPQSAENGSVGGATGPHDGLFCVQYRVIVGEPRGVELAERAVVNLLRSVAEGVGLGSADTVLVLRPTVYEAAALELWLGLSVGATVVLAPPGMDEDGLALQRLLSEKRVSFLHAAPATWRRLVETGLRPTRGLAALSGGVGLDQALGDQLLERCRVVFNAFGIPETTLYATLGRLEHGRPATIGRPLANTRVAVVDATGRFVPPGVAGQLVVAGVGVTGARELQGALEGSFTPDPFGSGVARVTGEMARWRADGQLELVPAPSPAAVQPSGHATKPSRSSTDY